MKSKHLKTKAMPYIKSLKHKYNLVDFCKTIWVKIHKNLRCAVVLSWALSHKIQS